MNVSIGQLMDQVEEHMMKTVEHMQTDFVAVRTGKASPTLVENVMVDYYGNPTRLKELAGITTPEARLLVVQPWDPSSMGAVEKAIIAANIGISPVNDGRVIRLPVPELSEERRSALAKQVKSRAEEARVAIRNIRRDGNEVAKKAQKGSEITEDELKLKLDGIQKLTDDYIKEVDNVLLKKEKELMSM
ncbi:MAG TPA: ribosome recycling factor [Lentisphaeria bacterium]|nr:MAG: ribosome recycling factor [Lentisphaerae bacterium GWF2_49_21]HBC87709.1 ribosome recycling factor [Lentisphaeria bacterium]